jgi:orotate phosphoribosyltransferase
MGADPVAYAIAAASADATIPIDAFSVRKQPKDHGTGRRIEGNFTPGSRVVVIEDVITSGGSALDAVRAVEDEGGVVLGVLAVLDREAGGRERIEATGVAVRSLLAVTDLALEPPDGSRPA